MYGFIESSNPLYTIEAAAPCKCPQDTDIQYMHIMMTSSNGNIFRVTDHLCREFTGHRWIPSTKASDAELWCFFFICVWINGWVNNREAGDLRRNRAHYDVIVMYTVHLPSLWGESTGHRWFPLTKASEAELWCFLWPAHEQTVVQTIETLVIWDAIALIMTSL